MLLFGHGFSIHYGEVEPPAGVDVALVAPKGPGHLVRRQYTEGSGVPGLIAVAAGRDRQRPRARARLRQGHRLHARRRDRDDASRTRPRPTCSASRPCSAAAPPSSCRPASRRSSRPATTREMAYFECLHELKLIVDLMYEKGLAGMRYSISNTAEYGDYTRGKRVDHRRDPRRR